VSAVAALETAAEALESRLELVLDERVGALTADQRPFLFGAAEQGRRLLATIRDLELVAAAGSGSLDHDDERLDLRVLCDAAPVPLVGDPLLLDRAVTALLRRAVGSALLGSTVEVRVGAGCVDVAYPAEGLDREDGLDLALAEAVAGLHAGHLVATAEDGAVRLSRALETAPPSLRLVAA
jgi:hypothetical protein